MTFNGTKLIERGEKMGKFIDITGCVMSEHGVPDSRLTVGRFDNFQDAVIARRNAEEKYFKNFSFKNSQEISTYVQ